MHPKNRTRANKFQIPGCITSQNNNLHISKDFSREDLYKKIDKLHQHIKTNTFVDFAFLLSSIVQISKIRGKEMYKDNNPTTPDLAAIFTTNPTEGASSIQNTQKLRIEEHLLTEHDSTHQ